jgi:hypothetical protein
MPAFAVLGHAALAGLGVAVAALVVTPRRHLTFTLRDQ